MKLSISLQFLNLGQSVGLLGRVISLSQDLYLHRTTQIKKKRTHTHKHPCLEYDSNLRSQQIFILSTNSNISLCLPNGLFHSCLLTKILYAFLNSSCMLHASLTPCSWFNYLINICWWAQIMNLVFIHISPISATSSLLNLHIFLCELFHTFNLCFLFHVRDQVSHSFKTTGKVIVLSILVFRILDRTQVDKRFQTEYQ
jgi:hypothetical protein